MFMPRKFSRIRLEIKAVRVERLQEISEKDAVAEGCEATTYTQEDIDNLAISDADPDSKALSKALGPGTFPARMDYMMLWDSLNAKRGLGWEKNPFVWVITSRRWESEAESSITEKEK